MFKKGWDSIGLLVGNTIRQLDKAPPPPPPKKRKKQRERGQVMKNEDFMRTALYEFESLTCKIFC